MRKMEQPICQRFSLPDQTVWYLIRDETRNSLWLTPSQILALYQFLQSNLDQLTLDAAYTPDVTMYEWSPPGE